MRQVLQGRAPTGQTNLLTGLDPALLDGVGVVQVRLSNSRLLDLREGLSQLLHYPYGCVEQTTSSTLPWLSLRELGPVLPELMRSEAEVNSAIRFGVDRLFTMQTAGGGLAYWPGDTQPLLYASAWGGFGIAWARKSGVTVPEEDFDRLMKYLSSALRGTSDAADQGNQSSQCLALLTLAVGGKAEPAYHEVFFKKRATLDAQQRAWLALAIMEAKGPREMVKTLLEETQPAKVDNADWWCAARTPATQLMAWCRYSAEAPGVDKNLTALMATRRRGHWYTTQGNAWAVLALGDYVQHVEKQRGTEAGVLMVNGQKHEFQLGDKNVCWTKEFPVRRGEVPKLTVTNHGKAPLFTDVTVEVRPSKMPIARADRGYTITRRYQLVDDEGKLKPAENLKVGDRVLVSLDVSVPNRAEYLAIEDPLPANFEAINPNFESQAAQGEELAGTPWQCDFHELRTDRALFFVNETYQGHFYLRYLARVRSAGTATAPAAKVEEMYEPDRFATTTTGLMKTAKWD
jgi:alpha-2-macroglobulin